MNVHNPTFKKWVMILGAVLLLGGVASVFVFFRKPAPDGNQNALVQKEIEYPVNLGGRVSVVGSDSITVSSFIPGQQVQPTTEVGVGSDTEIFRMRMKSRTVIDAAQAAYAKSHAEGAEPPLPYTKETITLKELSAGMLVNISLAKEKDTTGRPHALQIGVLPQ